MVMEEEKGIVFKPQNPELKHLSIVVRVSIIEHETYEAKLYSVTDGDTLRLRILPLGVVEKVRLLGIDAPETGSDEKARQQCRQLGVDMDTLHKLALISTFHIQWLCPKEGRFCMKTTDKPRDENKRVLAGVFVGDLCVNRLMVEHGYAMAWRGNTGWESYENLEFRARDGRKGIWGLCDEPYYPASSKSYHRPGCSSARYAATRFETLIDAKASGLAPCSNCIPDYTRPV
jgi:endonuclease YncB( thermonuclease family)